MNQIRTHLASHDFFWTIEFIPSADKILDEQLSKLGSIAAGMAKDPLLAGFAVTDRVHSDFDPDSVTAASHLLSHSGKQPLVHFSGKDRDVEDLEKTVARMKSCGLENMLAITGDRLKQEPQDRRPRYLESVSAIQAAKQLHPALFVGAAVNPFKYREEDAMAQYLKLGKKITAGADFAITQIGFDMRKYEDLHRWLGMRSYDIQVIANVMPMTAARARYIRQRRLPGVTISDSFLGLLEEEERLPDKGAARALKRLALQIVGLRLYGYAGIQLTSIHSSEKLAELRGEVDKLAHFGNDRTAWNKAWEASLSFSDGRRADPSPAASAWYLDSPRTQRASRMEKQKYKLMRAIHAFAFNHRLTGSLAALTCSWVKRNSLADSVLVRIERSIKEGLLGCETCGMCRLSVTQYVCPETCPKGLANGACGGTTENLCEFRDRECVHSAKYRIAKEAGLLDQLETWLIPVVPKHIRNTSSWPPYFRGEGVSINPPARVPAKANSTVSPIPPNAEVS